MSSNIEQGLADLVTAIPGVSAITAQVFWDLVPARLTEPDIVLKQISGLEALAHDGPIGIGDMRLQVDCHASTAAVAKALRLAIVRALNGTSPTLSDGTPVLLIEHSNSPDAVASEAFADSSRFCATADFILQYQVI